MDRVVQQNAANAEQSASASEELASQATELATMVEDLRALVDGAGRSPHRASTSGSSAPTWIDNPDARAAGKPLDPIPDGTDTDAAEAEWPMHSTR